MRHAAFLALLLGASALAPVATVGAAPPPGGNSLPAVSPDGRAIAFVSDRGGADALWVVDAAGGHERRISPAGFVASAPAWSQDGRSVRCAGSGADSGIVFAFPRAGGAPRPLVRVPGRAPRLSPDGRSVAWLSGPWQSTALFVAPVRDGSTGPKVHIAGGATTAWNPAWSPDGARIAYTWGDSTHVLQLHVVAKDGTGDRALTAFAPHDGSAQLPAWARSGKRLAFQVNRRVPHDARVWVVDIDGTHARPLGANATPGLDEAPAWFPDGRHLAFQSDRSGRREIWTMRDDGSDLRQVTGRAR